MTTEFFSTYVQAQTASGTLTSADLVYLLQLSLSPIPRKMTLGALADFTLRTGLANGDFSVGALGSIYADAGGFTTDGSGGAFFAGEVGIGTVNPALKLDITGTSVSGATAPGIRFTDTEADATARNWNLVSSGGNFYGSLDFIVSQAQGGNPASMGNRVMELSRNGGVAIGAGYAGTYAPPSNGLIVNGDVGIGTVNPSYPSDVVGDINTSTLYRVGGTAGITTTVTTASLVGKTITITGGIITGFA